MSISSDSLPPDRAGSPSSLIVSFAGCYLRQIGGWIAVADLIRLLALVDVPAPAVRQSVLRLKSRGFLTAVHRGGAAGYALTEAGLADLRIGDGRIFRYGQADPDEGWILAVFSVPESRRNLRHQLRSQLAWLGFGTVGAGVWAAPAALADPARALLTGNGLAGYVTWFHARALDPLDVAEWWDLADLRARYDAFLDRWGAVSVGTASAGAVAVGTTPARAVSVGTASAGAVAVGTTPARALTVTGPTTPAPATPAPTTPTPTTPAPATPEQRRTAFADHLRLVDDWRLFPRIDPGLPAALLPPDWPGPNAWRVFSALRQRWAEPGLQYVESVTDLAAFRTASSA